MPEDLRVFLDMICFVAIFYHLGNLLSALWDGGTPLEQALRHRGHSLDEKALDAALEEARRQGLKREFLLAMADCRRRVGQDGLRNGHLWWVRERLAGKPVSAEPPSFEQGDANASMP